MNIALDRPQLISAEGAKLSSGDLRKRPQPRSSYEAGIEKSDIEGILGRDLAFKYGFRKSVEHTEAESKAEKEEEALKSELLMQEECIVPEVSPQRSSVQALLSHGVREALTP